MKFNRIKEIIGFGSLILSAVLVVLILGIIIFDIAIKGFGAISWGFLIDFPKEGMTKGGIFPAIMGTIFVTLITTLFSIPLGVSAAIYLSEYAIEGRLTRIVRAAIRNLAGIPSIIYGLFGVAIFVQGLNFGTSVLSSGLTLGLLTLPWIIATSEEALKTVPQSYRGGSFGFRCNKMASYSFKCSSLCFSRYINKQYFGTFTSGRGDCSNSFYWCCFLSSKVTLFSF